MQCLLPTMRQLARIQAFGVAVLVLLALATAGDAAASRKPAAQKKPGARKRAKKGK